MKPIDHLVRANPTRADKHWGESIEGATEFARLIKAIESSGVDSPGLTATNPGRRPWLYAAAGFVGVAIISLPLWFSGDTAPANPLALPGNPYGSVNDDILEDGVVTESELLLAAQAVVSCTEELSDDPDSEAKYIVENDGRISFTILEVDTEVFEGCHFVIFRGIEKVWADQNRPPRAEDFYLYTSVVACTENRTGGDYGEMTRDPLGFVSTVGQRTINAALAQAETTYDSCSEMLIDQVGLYTEVLECVATKTNEVFVPLGTRTSEESPIPSEEDPMRGRIRTTITEAGFETLDEALEAHPDLFFQCLEEAAGERT